MRVRIREDAEAIVAREQSAGQPPSWYPSYVQWQYRAAIAQIAGRELPLLTDIEGGVHEHVYVLADTSYRDRPLRSHVIAIQEHLIVERVEAGPNPETPVDLNRGNSAWWVEEGLEVVRVLTSWVDGFSAFKRVRPCPCNDPVSLGEWTANGRASS